MDAKSSRDQEKSGMGDDRQVLSEWSFVRSTVHTCAVVFLVKAGTGKEQTASKDAGTKAAANRTKSAVY